MKIIKANAMETGLKQWKLDFGYGAHSFWNIIKK